MKNFWQLRLAGNGDLLPGVRSAHSAYRAPLAIQTSPAPLSTFSIMIMLWNPTLLLVLLIFLLFPRFLLACCLCVTLHITFLLNLIQQRRAKVIYITVLRIPENQVEDENLSVFSLMVKTKLKQNGKIKTLQRTLSAAKRIW